MTRLFGFVAACLLLATAARAAEPPRVVASIKPVHALVAAVMEGVATPHLLVPGGASPHAYALKPSDARALHSADLMFWIGGEFEGFLRRPVRTMPARLVTLSTVAGIARLPARAGGAWTQADHDGHANEPGHQGSSDMHLWLDPVNAQAMVRAIVATLAEIDPVNAPRYAANGGKLLARLSALDAELAASLAPVTDVPYVVFHDAYRYLERRYRLKAVGAVAVGPDRQPGARRLTDIRRRIARTGARCVFSEPQFPPALLATVLEETGAKAATLDPLGADLPPGPEAYITLMRNLARALVACLSDGI